MVAKAHGGIHGLIVPTKHTRHTALLLSRGSGTSAARAWLRHVSTPIKLGGEKALHGPTNALVPRDLLDKLPHHD